MLFGKEAPDGTKYKEKFKDENDVTCEKYHHLSDGMDYFLCSAYNEAFNNYLNGSPKNYKRPMGVNATNPRMRI